MKTASVTKTMRQQLGTGLVRFSGVVSGVAPAFRRMAFMNRASIFPVCDGGRL
jgi:hypothetical protein